jgi:hypothetical protein
MCISLRSSLTAKWRVGTYGEPGRAGVREITRPSRQRGSIAQNAGTPCPGVIGPAAGQLLEKLWEIPI